MKEASSSSITTSSLRPREAQLSLHDDDEDDDDDDVVLVVVGVVLRDHNATKTSRLLRLPFRSTFRMSILQEEEEEEEEEAILVGVVDDDVATENMTTRMMICAFMCVCFCVSLRADIMENLTHFHLTTTL